MTDSRTATRDGERFAFGANWRGFVEIVDEARVEAAEASLSRALGADDLSGRTFLDVGCGSGLFSVAAHRLGARVRAFDLDAQSVQATAELRDRFAADAGWPVERGSVLDEAFLAGLGRFDVVYSWGVLHHTGDLWRALEVTAGLVAPGGSLFVSIYNDQGLQSRMWRMVKRRYNRSGPLVRRILLAAGALYFHGRRPLRPLVRLACPGLPAEEGQRRGMSARHDLIDWIGGYPFEVATPGTVFSFLRRRGFELRHLTTCGGRLGCNEYVFERVMPGTG